MLETVSILETPEGATLKLRPAGAPVRALAWSIDLLIRSLLLFALGMVASFFGEVGVGFYLIAIFFIDWFYNVVFEVLRGATPGKRRLGLVVVNDNGTPVTWSASLLRNLLRVVDFLPFGYGLGLLWCLFHAQFKRLGDVAAGTLVVYRDTASEHAIAEDMHKVPAITPPLALDYPAQQALMGFAERADRLSPERRVELAELLQPLHRQSGEQSVRQLIAYAKAIAGRT